jgi:hypothetical protein
MTNIALLTSAEGRNLTAKISLYLKMSMLENLAIPINSLHGSVMGFCFLAYLYLLYVYTGLTRNFCNALCLTVESNKSPKRS